MPQKIASVLRLIIFALSFVFLFLFLSGGNRRKLSTAIALVGNPPIVFLVSPHTSIKVYYVNISYINSSIVIVGAFMNN